MNENERQTVLDEEHLKLLRLGYLIAGIADAFFALIPLIYVAIGIMIAFVPSPRRPNDLNPAVFGLFFAAMGLFFSLFLASAATLKLLAARGIGQRRSRTLCLIAAGLSCLQMPWGTALGVMSFMTLSRPTVKALFEPQPAQLAPAPPMRPVSRLFEDEEVIHR